MGILSKLGRQLRQRGERFLQVGAGLPAVSAGRARGPKPNKYRRPHQGLRECARRRKQRDG